MLLAELLTSYAANTWLPGISFAVSLTFPILIIVYMRWGALGAINAGIGGFMVCLFSDITGGQAMTAERIITSVVGHLCLTVAPLIFILFGKGDIKKGRATTREKWYMTFLYVGIMYLAMNVGFAAAESITLQREFFPLTLRYLSFNGVTLIFSVVVAIVVRKTEGLFEDQKTYMFRLERERLEQRQKNNHA